MEAGVDSLGAVELRNMLQATVGEGVTLPSTVAFDHPTARQLALHFEGGRPLVPDDGRGLSPLESDYAGTVGVASLSMVLPMSVSGMSALQVASRCGRDLLRERERRGPVAELSPRLDALEFGQDGGLRGLITVANENVCALHDESLEFERFWI